MASYMTVAEADIYFVTRLNVTVWTDSKSDQKTIALAEATTMINQLNYKGNKYLSTQTNEFPRGNDTTTPDQIKEACAEIALSLLDGIDPDMELDEPEEQ